MILVLKAQDYTGQKPAIPKVDIKEDPLDPTKISLSYYFPTFNIDEQFLTLNNDI